MSQQSDDMSDEVMDEGELHSRVDSTIQRLRESEVQQFGDLAIQVMSRFQCRPACFFSMSRTNTRPTSPSLLVLSLLPALLLAPLPGPVSCPVLCSCLVAGGGSSRCHWLAFNHERTNVAHPGGGGTMGRISVSCFALIIYRIYCTGLVRVDCRVSGEYQHV